MSLVRKLLMKKGRRRNIEWTGNVRVDIINFFQRTRLSVNYTTAGFELEIKYISRDADQFL